MNGAKDNNGRVAELEKERDAYAQTLSDTVAAFNERARELTVVKRIVDSVRWGLDLQDICVGVVDIIIDDINAESCSLWLVDESGENVELIAARERKDGKAGFGANGDSASVRLPLGEGAAGWVAMKGVPLLINDAEKNGRFKNPGAGVPSQARSSLCLPVADKGKVIGVLNVSHSDIGVFAKENERVLDLVAAQAALALSNVFLFKRIQDFNERLEKMVDERTVELRYSESKYRSFTENAGEAIFVVERESGRIIEVNNLACEYTVFSRSELVGKDIMKLFTPPLADRFRQTLREGGGRIDGYAMLRRAGDEFHTDIAVNVFLTHMGEVAHLIVRDTTQNRLLEARLKDYSKRLEGLVEMRTEELHMVRDNLLQASKMAAIGEIASGVAHEINNPIAIISGYAESLAEKAKAGGWKDLAADEIMWSLSIIASQAERCKEIISSLLNFTRRREMTVSAVDVNVLVRQAAFLSMGQAGENRPATINRLSPGIPMVRTDASMLEQILLNIYSNAVSAAAGVDGGMIITETSFDGVVVRILIKDTGAGITPSNLVKIFNPFFTTKPVGKGTGLGLSICQQLIERLHGRISVESEPGEYTKFTITIPMDVSLIEHEGEKEDAKNGESKDSVASCRR